DDGGERLRREGQLGDRAWNAERVVDGRGDCRANGVDAALACTLQAERVERRRRILSEEHVERRHFARSWHEIIGEVDRQGLAPLVVKKFLEQCAPYSLLGPAGVPPRLRRDPGRRVARG